MNMMDWVGQTLGQYRIEAPLGAGGMGQVFRGMHVYLNRPVAIKVMQANVAADPTFRARFLQEAKSAAALKHPNIVEIYDFNEQNGTFYLVMELMPDGSLRTLLRQRTTGQPWPLSLGLDLVRQTAEGMAAAHAKGMVHRDIKPDNLLLNRLSPAGQEPGRYQLKISDFGLARMAEGGGLTATGVPMGTLAYMSPEQCQAGKLDGRSDLYSLGVVLYEIATGSLPFQIDNFTDAFNKHLYTPPPPPRQTRPDLPLSIEAIILRCLAKKPEERYATGTELAEAVQRAMGDPGLTTMTPLHLPPVSSTPVKSTALEAPGAAGPPPPVVSTLLRPSSVPRVRVLDHSGQTLQVAEVTSRGLTLGRQPGSDLVLQDQAISRQHLRIQWDGKQVSVMDLGSSNGTWLGEQRLPPQVSQIWMAGQAIRVGPFWLRLEAPSPAGAQSMPGGLSQTVSYSAAVTRQMQGTAAMWGSGRIGLLVEPGTLTITPGQPATIKVTLVNQGNIVDWLTINVEGVAPEWVQGPTQEVQLNPGMQETVELRVNVARTASNLANDYPVLIRARSREKPDESGTGRALWTVLPFTEETLRIEPRRASGKGKADYTITVRNDGNTAARHTLSGDDDEQKLAYHFGQNEVALEPGREARVPLTVQVRRHWVGREQRQPFQIHARPAGSSIPLTTPAEFVNKAVLPGWVLPVVGVVLAASLALGAFLGPLRGSTGPLPTPTPTTALGSTPTTAPSPTPTTAPSPTPTTAPSPTPTTAPSPTPTTAPSPTPTTAPSPVPPPIPASAVTPVATGLNGAIGSWYVPSQDRLYFVEFSGNLSALDNVSSGSPIYHVLGTGYTNPEDVVVTADGNSAYITERSGDLVHVSLSSPDRSQATFVASGLTIPHQIILDETDNVAYVAQFANPGLVRIDLTTGSQTPVSNKVQNVIGLLMTSDFNTAYVTEQLSNGTGQLVRVNVASGNSMVLATSTMAPLFEMAWANANHTALLVTERDPANKVWYFDLTQPSAGLQFVASVGSRPSSVAKVSSDNLYPLLICANSEIDKLT